jgi:hypothetical protein
VAMPVRTYLWQTWFRTALGVVPFAVACALAERFWPVHNLAIFFLQIAAVLPLLPLALALIFREEFRLRLGEWKKRRSVSGQLSDEYKSSTTTVG